MTDDFYIDPEGIVPDDSEEVDLPDDPEADAVPTEHRLEEVVQNDPVPENSIP